MTQSVNLLERTPAKRPVQDGYRQLVLGLSLLVLVLGTVSVLQRRNLNYERAELARTRAQTERLQREQSALAAPNAAWLASIDTQEHEVQAVEAVAQQLQSGNLGRTRSFADQLRAFGHATAPGVWLTGLRLDNTTDSMTVDGKALDASQVPGLIQALEAEPHFGGTRFASIELRPGDPDGAGKARDIVFRIVTPSTDYAANADSGHGAGAPATSGTSAEHP